MSAAYSASALKNQYFHLTLEEASDDDWIMNSPMRKENIVRNHFIDLGGAVVFGFTPGLWTIPKTDDELPRQALNGARV